MIVLKIVLDVNVKIMFSKVFSEKKRLQFLYSEDLKKEITSILTPIS